MHAADRLEFPPRPSLGTLRALGLVLLAHAFLLVALRLGVQWKRETVTVTAEAELWSVLPQEAAPKAIEVPSEALPPATEAPPPPPPTAQAATPNADIVLAKEKRRLRKEKQRELENERLALAKQEKMELLKQDKLDKLKLEKLEKLKQEKLEKEKKAALDKKNAALEAKRQQDLLEEQEQLETQRAEIQRAANLKRMSGLAGATGGAEAKGSALQASGPSPNYPGRIRARIRPNIVFTEDLTGNPKAEVEVRTAPDGTIISSKLIQSSGVKSWDDAVLKAIVKTESLPKDTDGRVPSAFIISFRPKD